MKKIASQLLMLVFFVAGVSAQKGNWSLSPEPQKVFIENKGQWSGRNNLPGSQVLFASDYDHSQVLFTKKGLTYRLEKKEVFAHNKEEQEREAREKQGKLSHKEWEEFESKQGVKTEVDYVQMEWEGANPNVEVVPLNTVIQYFNYGMGKKSIDHANGYEKLLYKNLYMDIDVEYVFHPKGGIEYSFILHPGADPSVIKMKYSDVGSVRVDSKKNIRYATKFGDIIEHAPTTFYQGASNNKISSAFVRNDKTISFVLGSYDKTKTVVIDPWVQSPAFNTQWDCVWECEKDALGNVYIIGGVMSMQLLKYNAAGTLQWTYTTPYDTSNCWLGTFATDDLGNSYVTAGSIAQIEKISTAGTLVWNNTSPGGIFSSTEFWSISFNCDQTQLVIGGTGNTLPPQPYIYKVDMNSGNVTTSIRATDGALFPTEEVRSITASGNGKYYFLTHDSIGYLNQNFSVCSNVGAAKYYADNTYHLGYKCENFRVNNTGIPAIRTYGGYVYVNRGNRLDKRNFGTAALVASVAIPGGAFSTSFGSSYVENSGIDIDANGHIFVGSKNQVVEFDQNLTQLNTYATTFNVYDVHVSAGGNIIACGSTGTASGNGARTGSIQSFAANAGSPVATVCCDASICFAGPFCTTDGPVTLTPSTPGGVWSGTGITNPVTGVFSPSAAGQGTHYVVNSIACGRDSIPITVNICASLSVCREANGSLTVSNGTGPYRWFEMDTVQNCSACLIGCIIPPGCASTTYSWQQFATGANATAPEFPVRILDANNNELIVPNSGNLTPCSTSCSLTASTTPTGTTCGNNNGAATVTAAGGTPTGYTWSNGGTNSSISNVAAGTYNVTVTAGACTATASAVVSSSTPVTASATSTNTGCTNTGTATATLAGGSASTYVWSNGGNGATISNLAAGTYTVTVTSTGNCSATASTTVASSGGITASASSTNAGCTSTGTATAAIGGGTASTYVWSNGGNTATISNLAAGTYTVTITSTTNCTATASTTVVSIGGITASATSTDATCGSSNGSATATVTGGSATGYTWSNGATSATASNLVPGTYTVTITANGNCSATASTVVGNTGGPVLSTSSTSATCNTNNGSATVTITSGTATGYSWNNGATTATASNLGAGTYTVTVTGNGGCSATASVTVTSSNGVVISAASTNTSCGNSNGTVTVNVTQGNATGYSWSNGATTSSQTNLPAGDYFVTVTDAGGCSATASATVGGSGSNNVLITSDKSIMCSGDSAYICAPAGYVSYQWNTGATTPCIYAKNAGNYYVTVTDNGNCTAASNHLPLNVHPYPPVSISVNGDTLLAYNSVSYQWYLNGVAIPNANTPLWIATTSGSYTVLVTDANGCTALSLPVVITISGISDIAKESVSIYPNPNNSNLWNINLSNGWIGANCDVFDAEGRLVHSSQIKSARSELELIVAGGVYMMRISLGNKTVTQRLVRL